MECLQGKYSSLQLHPMAVTAELAWESQAGWPSLWLWSGLVSSICLYSVDSTCKIKSLDVWRLQCPWAWLTDMRTHRRHLDSFCVIRVFLTAGVVCGGRVQTWWTSQCCWSLYSSFSQLLLSTFSHTMCLTFTAVLEKVQVCTSNTHRCWACHCWA